MGIQIAVEIEDVNGSFARLIDEAPKKARQFLSTAVFRTAAAVQRTMEQTAVLGPEGQGLTPFEHIRLSIEQRGRTGGLMQQVGIFDDPDQVSVAMFNEYSPDRQPFMRASADRTASLFLTHATEALQQAERYFSQGF